MKKFIMALFLSIIIFTINLPVIAHSGRTDANGGHWDRKAGTYHYHNNGNSNINTSKASSSTTVYQNTNNKSSLNKEEIIKYQEKLNNAGYNCGIPDGIIGKKTISALYNYQRDNNLSITGAFDIATKNSLNNIVTFTDSNTQEISNTGEIELSKEEKMKYQEILNNAGYDCGKPDGIIGKRTTSAIKEFQKECLLSVTGKLNYETISALDRL